MSDITPCGVCGDRSKNLILRERLVTTEPDGKLRYLCPSCHELLKRKLKNAEGKG